MAAKPTIKNPVTVGNHGGGALDVLNGVIEEYKANSSTIDANTFVEFVNANTPGAGEDTQLSLLDGSGFTISAVALDDTHVFVAHSMTYNYYYLYGMVCTIDGTTITAGTGTQLSTGELSGEKISVVRLDDTRVFIAHNYASPSHYLYGMVCTIDGTTITAGTDTQLSSGTGYGGGDIKAAAYDGNRVFIAFYNIGSARSPLNGMVCTIDGTTITAGSLNQVDTNTSTGGLSVPNPFWLDDSRVLVIYGYVGTSSSADRRLVATICTISGTTITSGSQIVLAYNTDVYKISALQLDNARVFIAYNHGSSAGGYLYGMVCTVDNLTISHGASVQLSTTAYTGATISALKVKEDAVFIAHSSGSTYRLYGMVCTIDGTTITAGTDTALVTRYRAADAIATVISGDGDVVVFHNYGNGSSSSPRYLLNAIVTDMSDVFRIKPAEYNIHGLTKTQCTTDTAGEVWVLNTDAEP